MSTRASIAFGLALFATVWPCTLAAGGAASALATEDHMVESGDPGIRLFIRNKHPVAMTQFRSQRTLLYVHGATQAASSTFDLQVNGESWMDYIARQGYDVYLVDLRGYGRSTRPPEFAQPANEDPPVVRTNVAVRDLAAAVNFVLTHRKLSSLNLMGWSWGTVLTGRYASEHKGKVHRLVLFAPIWLHEPPTQGPLPPLGAYRTWTMDDQGKALQAGAPETRKDELLPPEVFAAWSAAELATDLDGAKQLPPVIRTPNGIYGDDREFWTAGKALSDPSEIASPTLVIVRDWEGITPPVQAQVVFSKLVNAPERRLVQIGEATHIVLLEKNRLQLYHEVQAFLDD
jgi:pimeloyl-ACP methyl ester carboxylesterase